MPCKITLYNQTPPAWKATILEAGVVFSHAEGGTTPVGPFGVNLGVGQSYQFDDLKPDLCVDEIFISLRVRSQYEPNDQTYSKILTDQTVVCIKNMSIKLGKKTGLVESLDSKFTKIDDVMDFTVSFDEPEG